MFSEVFVSTYSFYINVSTVQKEMYSSVCDATERTHGWSK